jgi:hypothetical protein
MSRKIRIAPRLPDIGWPVPEDDLEEMERLIPLLREIADGDFCEGLPDHVFSTADAAARLLMRRSELMK